MACEGGGQPAAVERRRLALRALLAAGGEASSSSSAKPAVADDEAVRRRPPSKGLLRGLRCTSAAAAQAFEPVAAAAAAHALRSSADWRGLGCTSAASQVHAPVDASRSSADWRERRRRRMRGNNERPRKARGGGGGGGAADGARMGGDVWCTPGMPFHAEASSVDCVVAPHQSTVGTRRRTQAERSHRERPGGAPAARRITMREHMSSSPTHSPPHHDMPLIDADSVPLGGNPHHLSGRRHSRIRVEEEIMMFRTRLLLGRLGVYDQYQDWRLDVDNMTYEELLDLEDRMGYVSTGLREDEIIRSLRMVKQTPFNTKHFSTEMDRSCSICQEEFGADEEIGKLSCGHNYHVHCIKLWLSRKNSCPVCKTAISKT